MNTCHSHSFLPFRPDFIGIGIPAIRKMLKQVQHDNIRIVCFLSLLLTATHSKAQKEGNIWTFPDRVSINFNDIANIMVDTSADGSVSGFFPLQNNSTIADSAGNLFCYATAVNLGTHSTRVYDRTHHIMPNGNNLQGNGIFSSILLPYPGIDSLIYLFHFGRDPLNTSNFMLFYSLINKNLNGGLGDVVLRDSMILYGTLANNKLAACKHGNGRDWWLFTTDYISGEFSYFLVTSEGVSNQSIQNIGAHPRRYYGKLLFSNDGRRLIDVSDSGYVDVYDFDRCTGQLGNYLDIGEHILTEATGYYSSAFSTSGNLIYVSPFYLTKVFYQWNLNAGDLNAIKASKTLLNQYPDTGIVTNNAYFWHNLAPDGKIYIPIANNYLSGSNGNTYVTQHLDVIEYPDSPGVACHYIRQGFSLNGKRVCGALPNMPYYGLREDSGSVCDSLTHIGINETVEKENYLEVFPNPSQGVFSVRLKDVGDQIKELTVQTIFGKEIYHIKNFSSVANLSDAAPGIYFVRVITEKKKMFVAKVMKL